METLSQAIKRLQELGYVENISRNDLLLLIPVDWKIDEIVRFEGKTNPSDNSIMYAVSNRIQKRKALIINAYGIYGDDEINNVIRKIMKSEP